MADIKTTLDERGKRYGKFLDHAAISQGIKDAMASGRNWESLPPYMKESLDMVAHKIGRILNGDFNYIDSWRDQIGFLQLVVDILETTEGATDSKTALVEYCNGAWVDPVTLRGAVVGEQVPGEISSAPAAEKLSMNGEFVRQCQGDMAVDLDRCAVSEFLGGYPTKGTGKCVWRDDGKS